MAASAMKIRLAIDPARARLWQRGLADDLRASGHDVSIALRPVGPPQPWAIGFMLGLERLAYGARPQSPGAPWTGRALKDEASPDGEADLEIDLTGHRPALDARRTLRPVYGEALVEDAAIAALLDGRIPAIGVADSDAPHAPWLTRPAVEDPMNLSRALDNLGTRMASLLKRAVELVEQGGAAKGAQRAFGRHTAARTGGLRAQRACLVDPCAAAVAVHAAGRCVDQRQRRRAARQRAQQRGAARVALGPDLPPLFTDD